MIGQSFAEEIDCGNFFDNIDDFIDFPNEDVEAEFGNGESNSLPSFWSTQPEPMPESDPVLSSKSNSDTSTELYVPFEEIVQLEWLSSFADDSFLNKKEDSSSTNTDSSSSHSQFRSSSPVSVLERSSSSSQTTTSGAATALLGKHGRPRSKRPRPIVQEPKEDQEKHKEQPSSANASDSRLVIRIPTHLLSEHNRKMKKKAKVSSSSCLDQEEEGIENHESSSSEQAVRKCMHCEVTKTPQWRQGPMGPKTLCNACGVRYKSGRLFPEYRPAASPTFMPSLHSNSHKKVVEMRSKKCDSGPTGDSETGRSYLRELIPKNTGITIDHN